jgi:hypothetical protein
VTELHSIHCESSSFQMQRGQLMNIERGRRGTQQARVGKI